MVFLLTRQACIFKLAFGELASGYSHHQSKITANNSEFRLTKAQNSEFTLANEHNAEFDTQINLCQ
jgi:hypothetical protein